MRKLIALFALLPMLLTPVAAAAQDVIGSRTVMTMSWVEEWDPVREEWVRVDGEPSVTLPGDKVQELAPTVSSTHEASRYAKPYRDTSQLGAVAQYGPFVVLGKDRAALVGSTGEATPHQFDAMLSDFPGIAVLEMIEAPGTTNDIANLALGRRIRDAGIATHVPSDGSVRSGAVELFLAGTERTIETGAYFAVHSWLDNHGRQPRDFAPDAPENRLYIDFYVEMGMTEAAAREFYAMTNSVPHEDALWLRAEEMARWVSPAPSITQEPSGLATFELAVPSLALPSLEIAPVVAPQLAIEPVGAIAVLDVSAWPGAFAS